MGRSGYVRKLGRKRADEVIGPIGSGAPVGAGGTLVSAAALYAADTNHSDQAKAMIEDGGAVLMESEEWSLNPLV
jgi:hypothetical protein